MTKKQKKVSRNLVVFEAPVALTEKARLVAEECMISTSALCRTAVNQYIHRYEAETQAADYAVYSDINY